MELGSQAPARFISLWQRGQSSGSTAQDRRMRVRHLTHLPGLSPSVCSSTGFVWLSFLGLRLPSALANHPA